MRLIGATVFGLLALLPCGIFAEPDPTPTQTPLIVDNNVTITYQGHYLRDSTPFTGSLFVVFTLYSAAQDGDAIATIPATGEPVHVQVDRGLFAARLPIDLSVLAEDRQLWLEVATSDTGDLGSFTTLLPRHEIALSPVSAYALRVSEAGVSDLRESLDDAAAGSAKNTWVSIIGDQMTGPLTIGAAGASVPLTVTGKITAGAGMDVMGGPVSLGTAATPVPLTVTGKITGNNGLDVTIGQVKLGTATTPVPLEVNGKVTAKAGLDVSQDAIFHGPLTAPSGQALTVGTSATPVPLTVTGKITGNSGLDVTVGQVKMGSATTPVPLEVYGKVTAKAGLDVTQEAIFRGPLTAPIGQTLAVGTVATPVPLEVTGKLTAKNGLDILGAQLSALAGLRVQDANGKGIIAGVDSLGDLNIETTGGYGGAVTINATNTELDAGTAALQVSNKMAQPQIAAVGSSDTVILNAWGWQSTNPWAPHIRAKGYYLGSNALQLQDINGGSVGIEWMGFDKPRWNIFAMLDGSANPDSAAGTNNNLVIMSKNNGLSTPVMTFDHGSGNVGIGIALNTEPGARLHVNGAIKLDPIAPAAAPTMSIFANSADGKIYANDSSGSGAVLSSHLEPSTATTANNSSFNDSAVSMPWSFTHKNVMIGKQVTVDMSKAMVWIEKQIQKEQGIEGGKLFYESDIPTNEIKSPEAFLEEQVWTEVEQNLARDPWLLVKSQGGPIPPEAIIETDEMKLVREEIEEDVQELNLDAGRIETVKRRVVRERILPTGRKIKKLAENFKFEDGKLWRRRTPDDVDPNQILIPEIPQWITERVEAKSNRQITPTPVKTVIKNRRNYTSSLNKEQ